MKAIQIYPSKTRIEPNDKFTKILFRLTNQQFDNLLGGNKMNLTESKTKKFSNLQSTFKIFVSNREVPAVPLDEFDRAVLSACTSEFLSGNRYTTPKIIWRALTGNVGIIGGKLNEEQLKAIERSICKMNSNFISSENLAINLNLLKYKGVERLKNLKSGLAILPARFSEEPIKINGHIVDNAIEIENLSPLYEIAKIKKQLLQYDSALLYTGGTNSREKICVTNYVARRIMEIVLHKNLNTSITFDDVFSKCRIEPTNLSKKISNTLYHNVFVIFDNFKGKDIAEKVIDEYKVLKQGAAYHSVQIIRK